MRSNIQTVGLLFQNKTPFTPAAGPLLAALGTYVSSYLQPAWGVNPTLSLVASRTAPVDALLVFADDSDQAGTLGYHDWEAGKPVGYVFVATSQQDGEEVSVVASHELAELLVDPDADQAVQYKLGSWVAKEICDPVEGNSFQIGDVAVSDFVLPAWFGGTTGPFDQLHVLTQPYHLAPGGYALVWHPGLGWHQVQGMLARPKGPDTYRRLLQRSRLEGARP